jgi:hypothetical protein
MQTPQIKLVAAFWLCGRTLHDEQADKRTHKQEKSQKTRRKTAQEQNINGKHAECDHVKKGEKKSANQNP